VVDIGIRAQAIQHIVPTRGSTRDRSDRLGQGQDVAVAVMGVGDVGDFSGSGIADALVRDAVERVEKVDATRTKRSGKKTMATHTRQWAK